MRHLFIVDPLERLSLAGDTSYALMLAATARGDEVWTCEPRHLGLEHDRAVAAAAPTAVRAGATSAEAFALGPRAQAALAEMDCVWVRQDPPVDVAYLHATWILEQARGQTLFVNDPRGLRDLGEHLAVLRFPALTPPTVVTRDAARLAAFLVEQGGAIVVKPVDGFGGLGIFVARTGDPNLSSIFETSTGAGTRWTVAQRYLPEAVEGDKRVVVVDGEPIGAVLRVPPPAEARGNLHVGGRPVRAEVTARDRELVAAVAPTLREFGQVLVGLDVIGGMLTELNITSPTGIRHIAALEGRDVAGDVLERVARLAAARRR